MFEGLRVFVGNTLDRGLSSVSVTSLGRGAVFALFVRGMDVKMPPACVSECVCVCARGGGQEAAAGARGWRGGGGRARREGVKRRRRPLGGRV